MFGRRRLLALAAASALLGAAPPPHPVAPVRPVAPERSVAPRRIVSLNLCADQLLIALADRSQIAGLTEWARDPERSYYAARAQTLPFTHRSAEEVMRLRPDLVIGAPFRTQAALGPLKARGIRMIALPTAESLAGIDDAIATVAGAIGHPERGAALIAAIDAQLAAIGPPPGRGRVAAYYQRQGYLTGTGTLVDEMMRRVGLVNLAGRLGDTPLSQLSIEQMALARPDVLLMDAGSRVPGDRGTAMLHHPLLDRVVPPDHRFYIPEALTTCGGPGYPQAVRLLADQLRAADRAEAASARPLAILPKSP